MPRIVIAKSRKGRVALSSNGEFVEVTDPKQLTPIEQLVAERQKVGLKLTSELKKHGLPSIDDDEPTEIIVRE